MAMSNKTVRSRLAGAVSVLAAVGLLAGCATGGLGGPAPSELGAGTSMGAVELLTADPEPLLQFYVDGVGLEVLADVEGAVTLGIDGTPLLSLVETDAPADSFNDAGLYHSAFLFPDEKTLADALVRTAAVAPNSFQGSSDHTVSQAFYFGDPDGNGVELYVDRPRDGWEWDDNLVTMGSAALDPNAFIAENFDPAELGEHADGVVMGHVHLRGGDLADAEQFYADTLGFAVTARSEGAVFFAADGYHHHLAVNVWSSEGAGERPESTGLGHVTIHVSDPSELDALEARLNEAEHNYTREGSELRTSDPWGTQIIVSAKS